MSPKVSVIIPAYNEEDVIEECLESLADQSFSDYQVYLIDDLSTDSTKRIIEKFVAAQPDRFKLLEYGKVGPGRARNLTAQSLSSPFLAFTDADCVVTTNWLESLVACFDDPKVAAVGGPQLAHPQANPFQRKIESFLKRISQFIDFYKPPKDKPIETKHNPLCNVMYRREVFSALGGFREDLFPGEDLEMDQRVRAAGHKILYQPNAKVYHHRPKNVRELRKVMFAYGRAQGKLVREKGVHRFLQAIGVLAPLFILISLGIAFFISITAFSILAFLILTSLFFRPNWNNQLGIFFNSFSWFTGFAKGWISNRSDPPGFVAIQKQKNHQS